MANITKVPSGYQYWKNSSKSWISAGGTIPTPQVGDGMSHVNSSSPNWISYEYVSSKTISTMYTVTNGWIANIPTAATQSSGSFYDQIGGKNVKAVSLIAGTYSPSTHLTTLTNFPAYAEFIELYELKVLTSIAAFPSTLKQLHLYQCTQLTSIPALPSGLTSLKQGFYQCTSLTTAPAIPNSVTDMSYCFCGCTALTTVAKIPSSVTNLTGTFMDCPNLTGNILIDSNATSYSSAFWTTVKPITIYGNSTILEELAETAPNQNVTVYYPEYKVYYDSTFAQYYATVSDKTKSSYGPIPTEAELQAEWLISDDISYDGLFSNCVNLVTSPTLLSTLTSLDEFYLGCTSLTTAPTIPSGVTSMRATFQDCASLTSAPVIPSGVVNLNFTFCNCRLISTAPTLPNVATMMLSCFEGCSSLQTVSNLPNSVLILSDCFRDCTSLTSVPSIPASVTSVESCFYNCSNLVNAPEFLGDIESLSNTFSGCTSLVTAPTIPDSVLYMGSCFDGCINLRNVELPEAVQDLSGCFWGCTSLETAPVIPNSVDNVQNCFRSCTSLTGIISINVEFSWYSNLFAGTVEPILLNGTSSQLEDLVNTSSAGNVKLHDNPIIRSIELTRVTNIGEKIGVEDEEGNKYVAKINLNLYDLNFGNILSNIIIKEGVYTQSDVRLFLNWDRADGLTDEITLPYTVTDGNIILYAYTNNIVLTQSSTDVSASVVDSFGSSSEVVTRTLPTVFFTIDFRAGGKEIAFGKSASESAANIPDNGLFTCGMDANFTAQFDAVALGANLMDFLYPDGSIYMTIQDPDVFSPNDWPGQAGKWGLWAEGQAIIGAGTYTDGRGETKEFGPQTVVGNYSHVLTTDQVPAHTHGSSGAHYHTTNARSGSSTSGGTAIIESFPGASSTRSVRIPRGDGTNGAHTHTSVGGGGAHTNMQPSVACYIWLKGPRG